MGRSRRFYVCEPHPMVGGQADVHRAAGDDGEDYAVKIARTTAGGAALQEEARVVAWLLERSPELHDVIAPILDEGEHEARPFLVLRWYPQRLDRYARRQGLSTRLRLAARLARAVGRLHDGPDVVVHRDIKPSNAFVEGEGERLLLADFAVAGARQRAIADFLTGQHTPGFAPVDQVLPRRLDALDTSWDVYGLAATAYALVADRAPDGISQSYTALTPYGAALRSAWQRWSEDPGSDALSEVEHYGGLPLSELVRLRSIDPLQPQDVILLREKAAEAAQLEGLAPTRGTRAATALLDVLRPALAPDPARRPASAAAIAEQLDEVADWLVGGAALPAPIRARRGRRAAMAVGSVALVGGVGLSALPTGPSYATVRVPAGIVTMGSPEEGWAHQPDEPLRQVEISRPFELGTTEVTQGLWRRVTGERPVVDRRVGLDGSGSACADYEGEPLVGDERPVVCVSWCDAVAFANRLSEREGLPVAYDVRATGDGCVADWRPGSTGWRLPTEAEWAHAARSGGLHPLIPGSLQVSPDRGCGELARFGNVADRAFRERFPWLDGGGSTVDFLDRACAREVLDDDGFAGLAPVGSFEPTRSGVYDLAGNVREWVFDVYTAAPEGGVDPRGPATGVTRTFRGSAFDDDVRNVHVANRGHAEPGRRMKYVGLRLARTLPEEP